MAVPEGKDRATVRRARDEAVGTRSGTGEEGGNRTLPQQHVKAHGLGVVCGAETGFRIGSNPDTVLAPDVAFVRPDCLPPSGLPAGFWPGAPDLAVEVLSPSDTVFEVDAKVAAWIEAATGAVWVVNPQRRVVTIRRAGTAPRTLSETATLTGDDIVAGFQMLVADIFAV